MRRDQFNFVNAIPHTLFKMVCLQKLGYFRKFIAIVETAGTGPELRPALDGQVEPFHFHILIEAGNTQRPGTARFTDGAKEVISSFFCEVGGSKYMPGSTSQPDSSRIANYLCSPDTTADQLVANAIGGGGARIFFSDLPKTQPTDMPLEQIQVSPIPVRLPHQHGVKGISLKPPKPGPGETPTFVTAPA